MEAIPGYLSLHQTADLMTLKWTPNQLMNGNVGELDSEKRLEQYNSMVLQKSSFFIILLTGFPFVFQCFLGLCDDNSFGGDRLPSLSSTKYANSPLVFVPPLQISAIYLYVGDFLSKQWWYCGFGESRWDPKTSTTFSQRGSSAPVSHLSRDWPATSRTAGPSTLESERKG